MFKPGGFFVFSHTVFKLFRKLIANIRSLNSKLKPEAYPAYFQEIS